MRLLLVLALASLVACAPPEGPPARTSGALVPTAEAFPHGYLDDVRGEEPLVAVTNADGETELHDLEGLVAPPIPGHERAMLRAIRATPDGSIWACHDDGIALYRDGTWTHHDFATLDVVGPCTSLDARGASDVYASVGTRICTWDGAVWDCFGFGETRAITLSPGHLWFVRASAHYDDLTVIDTVSRATPGLVRLGDVGTTESIVPVPGAEEVVVVGTEAGEHLARRATPDGAFTTFDAHAVVPLSADERYLLRVGPSPVACTAFTCEEGAEWSELVVLHASGAETTEVGHVTTIGPGGVPWRGLLVGRELRVRTETGLLALP